jgi:hypothetical protein
MPALAPARRLTLAWTLVVAIVLFRSALFVFRPQLAFDADQGVFGLMAKHLIEGRAFPLYMYGQNYILAVEAWMAAPMFLLFGVSVPALKLPLLLINVAAGVLLVTRLQREVGISAGYALIASLFFLLPPPGTTARLLEASGGNVEPFLYILLLWLTRRRPVWFGLILGVGFLQREFTAYGAIAIVAIEAAHGAWRRKADWQRALVASCATAGVWLVALFLRRFASSAGPGTDMTALQLRMNNNVLEAMQRVCFDPGAVLGGLGRLFTEHWPRLFGTSQVPLAPFGIESAGTQGLAWSGLALAVLIGVCVARIAVHARAHSGWWTKYEFCGYLVLVGALSAIMFAVARCGDVGVMRYDLLSIFGAVGLVAWALAVESRPWIRRSEVALVVAWSMVSATSHARIWAEYSGHPPLADKVLLIRHLDARNIRYATSDYWIAYYVTFLTNERIIVAANDFPRILTYEDQIAAHRSESIDISRTPCGDVKPIFEGVYLCPPR